LKAVTHDVFSLGIGLYLLSRLQQPSILLYLVLVFWLAFATNELIDVMGHVSKGGRPVRSFWTHSVFTAPAWGISVAVASAYVIDAIAGQALTAPEALLAAGLGVVFACSHLLLDSLTEGGVYLGRRRVALAHFRYDNVILNGAFTGLGVLLVFAAFF
jgi:hypothetical protein